MSTLPVRKVRFFMLAVNILVIALTVKSVLAFESKSDTLRQVLRHRDQLNARVLEALPADLQRKVAEKNLEQETVRLPTEKIVEKSVGLFERLEVAFEQALKWMEINKDKEVDTISIVGLTRYEQRTPIIGDKSFLPATLVIFFKKNEE